jgi:hypothetical protein
MEVFMMRKNIGPIDRSIRFIIAFALLALIFLAPLATGWKALFFIVAAFEVVTAAVAY